MAQQLLDTIRSAMKEESSFTLGINNRSTFVIAEPVILFGVEGGLSYGGNLRLYSGLYGLSNRHRRWLVSDPRFEEDSVLQSRSVGNLSIGAEVVVHRNKALTIRTAAQIGVGTQRVRYTFTTGERIDEHHIMVPLEFGTHASYSLSRYIYLSGGVGYRIQFGDREVLTQSAPYYTLGLGIALQTLYWDLRENY